MSKYESMTDDDILQAVRELEADLKRLREEREADDRRMAPIIRKLNYWKKLIGR